MSLSIRNTRACISCFEKKLKCDRGTPCSKCTKRKTSCLYSHVKKPRNTPKRYKNRVKEMEARLEVMEAVIERARNTRNQNHITQWSTHASMSKAVSNQHNQSEDLLTDSTFEILNILSPPTQSKVIKYEDLSKRLVRRSLPPAEDAFSLLQEYFESFNTVFPLYSKEVFMDRFDKDYYIQPLDDIGWWASLNATLALAYKLRGMRTLHTTDFNQKAYGLLQNALSVVQDLTMRQPELWSIQALLSIAIALQGTPNPRPASIIVAAAVKLSQGLGIHRQRILLRLDKLQAEQYKRVFWIGYMLDKDFSLQLNQPPVQSDLDYDIELPDEYPLDGQGVISGGASESPINFFRLRVQLAIIQSEIYSTLYSIQSLKMDRSARLRATENLDRRLTAWKKNIQLDFGPEQLIQSMAPSAILHVVVLYMVYFNCLTMIQSISYQGEYWNASAGNTVEGTLAGDPICVARTLCLPASRLAVKLVALLPRGDYACIWLLLHFYVSALVILLANIIQHPQDCSARSDMALVEPLLRLLESLSVDESVETSGDLRRIQALCRVLEDKAVEALSTVAHILPPREQEQCPNGRAVLATPQSYSQAADFVSH